MPRRKFIDKKTAQRFTVLARPQHEIHDETDEQVVFEPRSASTDPSFLSCASSSKRPPKELDHRSQTLDELASQYGSSIRGNEGEAAEYGIYYDDTEYDYMQHLRDVGSGGQVTWIEAAASGNQIKKDKGKQKLEDAIRDLDISAPSQEERRDDEDGGVPLLVPASIRDEAKSAYSFPSHQSQKSLTDKVIESQLAVPTEIAGFQPDMDWRLREALEALDDEAYVDAEDDGLFGEIATGGEEISLDEFERSGDFLDEDDDGWESDDTIKASSPPPITTTAATTTAISAIPPEAPPIGENAPPPGADAPPADPSFLHEFSKFKQDQKAGLVQRPQLSARRAQEEEEEEQETSSLLTTQTASSYSPATHLNPALLLLPRPGRTKRRKGAATNPSAHSMSSSALARTEQQTLLDARFDRLEAKYQSDMYDDDDGELADSASLASGLSALSGLSAASGFSAASRASALREQPRALRSDFDALMDDFLGGAGAGPVARGLAGGRSGGGARARTGKDAAADGLRQLDEIRSGLGPARVGVGAEGRG